MKEFNAKITGNKVVINTASFKDVQRLKQVILNEFKKSPIGVKLIGKDKTLFEKDVDFTGVIDFIKDTIIGIETSEEFNDVIFACLQYCTYKKVYKIDEALFDNESVPEARDDYYEILVACIEENLRPFIKSLISTWKTLIETDKISQVFNIM